MTTTQTQAEQKTSRMFSELLSPTREIWEPTYQELTLLIQKAEALDKIESMSKAGVDWDICYLDSEFIATDIFNQDEVRGAGETLLSAINKALLRATGKWVE